MNVGQIDKTQTAQAIQPPRNLSTQQLAKVLDQALTSGISFVAPKDGSGYYLTAALQPSAAQGEQMIKVDRELAVAVVDALKTGGRISHPEVLEKIMPRITDAGRYGQGEAVLARLLLAACDDRKVVKIDGRQINITDKAEATLNHELASFWGSLGAAARWGAHDPGIEPRPNFPDQVVDQPAQDVAGTDQQRVQLPKI